MVMFHYTSNFVRMQPWAVCIYRHFFPNNPQPFARRAPYFWTVMPLHDLRFMIQVRIKNGEGCPKLVRQVGERRTNRGKRNDCLPDNIYNLTHLAWQTQSHSEPFTSKILSNQQEHEQQPEPKPHSCCFSS